MLFVPFLLCASLLQTILAGSGKEQISAEEMGAELSPSQAE